MAFETYTPKRRRQDTDPKVTISSSGNFMINAAASEQWFSKAKLVQLLFDPESKTVAIRPMEKDADNALKLRRPARAAGCHISGQGFLDYYQIKNDKTRSYPLTWLDTIGAATFKAG